MSLAPESDPAPTSRGDATREALVQAAVSIFARDGYHAVSTRALARAAKVNQALINYHFGGKKGLYLAVFEFIAASMRSRIDPLADGLERQLDEAPHDLSRAQRCALFLPSLMRICDGVLALMLSEETEQWSQLIMREQQKPTAAFELLYQSFMGRMLALLTRLVQVLRGEGDAKNARLVVVGILGQLLVWRAAREGVLRLMRWSDITDSEAAAVRQTVHRRIEALVYG